MANTVKIVVNIILDILCCGGAIYAPVAILAHDTTKDIIVNIVFVLMAIYFAYSAVTKIIYLVKTGRN